MRVPVLGRSLGLLAVVIALGAALAACSSAATPSATAAPPTAAPPTAAPPTAAPAASAAPSDAPSADTGGASGDAITIENFAFSPASITVAPGTTVTWTNRDSAGHTVTADDGTFDSKRLSNGSSFSETFTTAGTYTYHCAIHPSMTATIVVQ